MPKFTVTLTQTYEVDLDANRFDDDFMAEFRESFFNFHDLEEHAEHIGCLFAAGITERDEFIEGYGIPSEMGIKARWLRSESEVYSIEDEELRP